MKIITITNDNLEYALLKSNCKTTVFMNPTQPQTKDVFINYLIDCRKSNVEENFLILCNDFDTTTFMAIGKILKALGLEEKSLVLFGINQSEVSTIHNLQKGKRNLGFFRAVYGKSYWNLVGKFNIMD